MAKKSIIIGGIAIAICAVGGLLFGVDTWMDQQAKQKVEQELSSATGLEVVSAEADVNLLKQQVTIEDIRFANLNSFPSPHLLKIDRIDIKTEGFSIQPLKIETMVIQDIEINLDLQTRINPQSPENPLKINAQELLKQIKQQEKADSSSNEPDLQIQQMQFKNIQVKANLKLPLRSNPLTHQFQIPQITLNDVTDENMPEKMSTALKEEILTELQVWLDQQRGVFPSVLKSNPLSL
ncbi:MAG: hypothetical protein AAFO04_28470 [Cyanobacteria bacterium J06592_8]